MSKETDAQYARSVDNVAYARSRCPESKKLCPKCGSELYRCKSWPRRNMLVCIECCHEEKLGGEKR